jgi:hypothetical protein
MVRNMMAGIDRKHYQETKVSPGMPVFTSTGATHQTKIPSGPAIDALCLPEDDNLYNPGHGNEGSLGDVQDELVQLEVVDVKFNHLEMTRMVVGDCLECLVLLSARRLLSLLWTVEVDAPRKRRDSTGCENGKQDASKKKRV